MPPLYGIIILMRFTVPQFLEYEAKVIGPLTFGQFIFFGLAGAVCFLIFFMVPIQVFIMATALIMGGTALFAFVKVDGRTLPTVLGNFLKFSIGPKMYIWKKKESPVMFVKEEAKQQTKTLIEDESALGIASKSRLKKIKTNIDIK